MFYSYCILFFIFSFLGWVMEVTLTLITDKKFVNRGFLLGPCCPIYGCGCLLLNLLLQNYVNNIIVLFILTMFTCSLLEYITSFLMEKIFKLRWWDYSQMRFNINGRITLTFTVFWGLLALCLIRFINPYIETGINKLPKRWFNILTIGFTIFLLLDLLITALGLKVFYTRLIKEHNLEVKDSQILMVSDEVMDNKIIKAFSKTIFSELNLATSNNSLIKSSNLYDLSNAIEI